MSEVFLPFGSAAHLGLLGAVLAARGADILSTWVASPRLLLEANPLARALGWRWGVGVNLLLASAVAVWPLPAIMLITASLLVAARNFQSAWLSRSMGEQAYRAWLSEHLSRTSRGLYVLCVVAQAGLVALVGAILVWASPLTSLPGAVGLGVLTYAAAALLYPLVGARRLWRQGSSAS